MDAQVIAAALLVLAMQKPAAAPSVDDLMPLMGKDAMSLAGRVLPPELRDRVVEGRVSGPSVHDFDWSIWFKETARGDGRDLCTRRGHVVQADIMSDQNRGIARSVPLTFGPVESWTEIAVLPAGERAGDGRCEAADYVSDHGDRERTVAAYRVLLAAMGAARARSALPFALTCRSEKPEACADARTSLAALPITAVRGIDMGCLESEKIRERFRDTNVYRVTCPTLRRGQPYQAEVAFGPSGNDGQSWRVRFVHRPGWPETIELSRSTVIWH